MELEQHEAMEFLNRIPKYELSYETMRHKKDTTYDVCAAIPYGKKVLCWFTFQDDKYVALFFDMDRERKLGRCTCFHHDNIPLALGTIVYGSMISSNNSSHNYYVIEDVLYYSGLSMRDYREYEKWYLSSSIVDTCKGMFSQYGTHFFMPHIWKADNEYSGVLPQTVRDTIGYSVHHIQYRSYKERTTCLSVPVAKASAPSRPKGQLSCLELSCVYSHDFTKPQYRHKTVFEVKADPMADTYHLFAYGKKGAREYFGKATVNNYETSVKLNKMFRIVRENDNLDTIEESDDEEEFQNTSPHKYVKLDKTAVLLCEFSKKFRKWAIIGNAPKESRIVHIGQLVRNYQTIR